MEDDSYNTQIRMKLYNPTKIETLEHSKYCVEKNCDNLIENAISLTMNGHIFYLCVCNHHLNILNAYTEHFRKNSPDYMGLVDISDLEKFKSYEEAPVLIGVPTKDDPEIIRVWCKFCDKFHTHGNVEGHRIAHCHLETPYSKRGYIIKKLTDDCPKYAEGHQWAIIQTDPPKSECQNCNIIVNSLEVE